MGEWGAKQSTWTRSSIPLPAATRPKAGLRLLNPGDLLPFHCGLEGWNFKVEARLSLIGYFEVLSAG